MQWTAPIQTLFDALIAAGARPVIVGGAVRDARRGERVTDYDIEVYGVSDMAHLTALLAPLGSVHAVGKAFAVLNIQLVDGTCVDVALPRTEVKQGEGHRGFAVTPDGGLDFATAARRRDFTINAMGFDVVSGCYLDPYDGMEDLQQGIVRHVDDATFADDPLRVYRAVRFAARLGFVLADATTVLCRNMVNEGALDALPRMRVWNEWSTMLLHAPQPSVGMELMRTLGITERYFPELHALVGIPQHAEYHPEGDVWNHTMMALDAMAVLLRKDADAPRDARERLVLLLAILAHDLGKATHTQIEADGRIRAIGHEAAGVAPTRTLLARLTDAKRWFEAVGPLVRYHLAPSHYYRSGARDATIRRLAVRLAPHASIRTLMMVAYADFLGRDREDARRGADPAVAWLTEQSGRLGVLDAPPEPLLRGRDLIALGMKPSADFGVILDAVYVDQIRGSIQTYAEALQAAERYQKRF